MSDKLLVALRPTNTWREIADAFVGIAVSRRKVEILFVSNANNKHMNGDHVVHEKNNVPCDVLATLREHGVPCIALSQIPFDPLCPAIKQCGTRVDPKESVPKA